MQDLISRQAAIDALHMHLMYRLGTDSNKKRLDDWINGLPSAQPELCEDAVSRQRLLSDLKELIAAWEKYPVMAEQIKGVEAAIGYVESIPSAQPERKKISNKEWVDFLSEQFTVSRTSAKEMLHTMMSVKREDNFKKQFSGGRNESRRR